MPFLNHGVLIVKLGNVPVMIVPPEGIRLMEADPALIVKLGYVPVIVVPPPEVRVTVLSDFTTTEFPFEIYKLSLL